MKIVADTDILSTFARIGRLDILKKLFEVVSIPPSVKVELGKGRIDIRKLDPDFIALRPAELKDLGKAHRELDKGEKECYVIAKHRDLPLASNETIVHRLCKKDRISYFSLPRILRFAIIKNTITRHDARHLVSIIEKEEHTVIKNKDEIFR